jgi:hypothetical protein
LDGEEDHQGSSTAAVIASANARNIEAKAAEEAAAQEVVQDVQVGRTSSIVDSEEESKIADGAVGAAAEGTC